MLSLATPGRPHRPRSLHWKGVCPVDGRQGHTVTASCAVRTAQDNEDRLTGVGKRPVLSERPGLKVGVSPCTCEKTGMCFRGHLGKEAAGSVGGGAGQLGVSTDSRQGCWVLVLFSGSAGPVDFEILDIGQCVPWKAVDVCPFSSACVLAALPWRPCQGLGASKGQLPRERDPADGGQRAEQWCQAGCVPPLGGDMGEADV